MKTLKTNPIFKEDYARYQKVIASINDEQIRRESTGLLLELARAVDAIDLHHNALLLGGKLPDAARDARINLSSIKKKLDNKINPYKNNIS
jgi:hypothetical protein